MATRASRTSCTAIRRCCARRRSQGSGRSSEMARRSRSLRARSERTTRTGESSATLVATRRASSRPASRRRPSAASPNRSSGHTRRIWGGCGARWRVCVENSTLEGATLEDDVRIGPYSHLRPGAYLEKGVEMGNFGEVKNARLRSGTKMHHFSYVGDADIGARVNIGAGTITLNYDGVRKNRTIVGEDAFIGSDTLLRAPVTVGAGATTGAGAVVTKDVPEGMVAVGMPARAIKKADRRKKAGQ